MSVLICLLYFIKHNAEQFISCGKCIIPNPAINYEKDSVIVDLSPFIQNKLLVNITLLMRP